MKNNLISRDLFEEEMHIVIFTQILPKQNCTSFTRICFEQLHSVLCKVQLFLNWLSGLYPTPTIFSGIFQIISLGDNWSPIELLLRKKLSTCSGANRILQIWTLTLNLLLAVVKVIQPMAGSNLQANYYWTSYFH